ncbi:hypothetical protein B0T16DRAFT_409535 [Cercophora newfieldiana]|uniref:Uncharacterized protein n=1 Tax=Cercophora newfieldiana TaxID=92897 RepID=A0AA40CSL8_9PEZI|nr:hypothetical protein B0T16DRAFT_409535 [Cercophora newfieldiana]
MSGHEHAFNSDTRSPWDKLSDFQKQGAVFGSFLYVFLAIAVGLTGFCDLARATRHPRLKKDAGLAIAAFMGCCLVGLLWPLAFVLFLLYMIPKGIAKLFVFMFGGFTECCGVKFNNNKDVTVSQNESDGQSAAAGKNDLEAAVGVGEPTASGGVESMELPSYPQACAERA